MTDIIPNRALGLSRQYFDDVEAGGADNFYVHAYTAADTDENLRDLATLTVTALIALSGVTEAGTYTPETFDDTEITVTNADDTANAWEVTISDITFATVAAATAWTNVSISYSAAGTDVDGSNIPIHWLDAVVTPNGGDIVLQFPDPYLAISQGA